VDQTFWTVVLLVLGVAILGVMALFVHGCEKV
jgi:hypothetical protein